jgi:hypothetical protein
MKFLKKMRDIFIFLSVILPGLLSAQGVVINELDADQPGADSTEFVELYGPSGTSLDGYVLVFFNGGDPSNASYQAVDLSGSVIPSSGYFVIGNVHVSNVNIVINDNSLQNGADAVVLYNNTTVDLWPNGSLPILDNAVDAVVYGTADSEDLELMTLFAQGQMQLDEGAANNVSSLSRVPNGGAAFTLSLFVAQAPTPGASNVGGTVGVISESTNVSVYPNPASEIINIVHSMPIDKVVLYDSMGKEVWMDSLKLSGDQLNVSSLCPGFYVLKLVSNSFVESITIVKI